MAMMESVEWQSVGLKRGARELQYFLYSQAFADGFRTTFAILSPALVGLYTGYFQTGLTLSLGAMCVSLTDAPGREFDYRGAYAQGAGSLAANPALHAEALRRMNA